MKQQYLRIIGMFSLSIFLFIAIQAFYNGIMTQPSELDSVMYHIPIAKSYLTGDIFSSPKSSLQHRFFPGAAEGILALFILLHIPLNLYNVLGVSSLFFACLFLGKKTGLTKNMILIYAAGFSSLTIIVRWLNIQIVDIWMAVFYAYVLGLLIKPEKKPVYFLQLGIALGMVMGTKYSGPLFISVLVLLFGKKLMNSVRVGNIFFLLVPFSLFGLFWYVRNFLVMGNPFYPLAIPFFPGIKGWALEVPVWKAIIGNPQSMINAFMSEYLGWSILFMFIPLYILYTDIKKKYISSASWFIILGLANFGVYLFLPNGEGYRVHVSNLRYSLPVFIPLMMSIFIFAKDRKKEMELGIFTVSNMLFSIQFPYHPKLLIIYIPLIFILWRKTFLLGKK